MSMAYLGETFDIHCGGKDLLFPHHENEIAQSEGATGKPYVRYWMHNGFINVDNEKMSKSKGNFFTVRDIAKEYSLEAVRLFMLSAHYRSPINFSREQIEAANASLTRLYTARDQLLFLLKNAQDKPVSPEETALLERLNTYEQRFDAAMDDDLNTADAIGAIFELVKDANVSLNADSSRQAVQATLDRADRAVRYPWPDAEEGGCVACGHPADGGRARPGQERKELEAQRRAAGRHQGGGLCIGGYASGTEGPRSV